MACCDLVHSVTCAPRLVRCASLAFPAHILSIGMNENHCKEENDDDDDSEFASAPPRKSGLSAPQLLAQLSRVSDRTLFRRLKNTLYSKSAWQQVTRIEDLCHRHVSHQWLCHLDACAGSAPDDYITNVQKKTWQQNMDGPWSMPFVWIIPRPPTGTRRNLQHR